MNKLQFPCQGHESVLLMENEINSSFAQLDWKLLSRIEYIKNKPCHTISLINKQTRNLGVVLSQCGFSPARKKITEVTENLSTLCKHLIEDTCSELRQIEFQNIALKIQTIFEAQEVIKTFLLKRIESAQPEQNGLCNPFPLTAIRPICTYCRMGFQYQKLETIKAELDQKPILKLYDTSIPIPIEDQFQQIDENCEGVDMQEIVGRFLSRKNQMLSAKVSNVDLMLNEALNIMQTNSKVNNYYKALSNQELVILLHNSHTIVNSICKELDDHFRQSLKKQLSSIMTKMSAKYYSVRRKVEQQSMQSHETQTVEVKNGLSIRALQMKIQTLKKQLNEKIAENNELHESIGQLRHNSQKANLTLNNVTQKMQQTIAGLDHTLFEKNQRISKIQSELSDTKIKLIRASQISFASPDKKISIDGKIHLSRFSKISQNKSQIKGELIEEINKGNICFASEEGRIHFQNQFELPDPISQNSSSESGSQENHERQKTGESQNRQSRSKRKRKSNTPKHSDIYIKPELLNNDNIEARRSVERISKILSSATSLNLLLNSRDSRKLSNLLNVIEQSIAQRLSIKQYQIHEYEIAPSSIRNSMKGVISGKATNHTLEPSTETSGLATPQEVKEAKNHALQPVINIISDPPRCSFKSNLSMSLEKNHTKKLSGIDFSGIPNAMQFRKLDKEEQNPARSSFLKSGGGSSFHKYYQNVKSIQNAINQERTQNCSPNKNQIQIQGYSSLVDFYQKKNKQDKKKSQIITTTPRNMSEHKNRDQKNDEQNEKQKSKNNILQTFSLHVPNNKKISIQTVQLLSSKLFPRFSNVIKEVQKNSKSKIPSKKKILKQIFRKDFDIEDLDLFIGVSEAYQFQQSNYHSQNSNFSQIVPQKFKQQVQGIFNYLELLKKSNPSYYCNLKSFLRFPYQTAVNKLYQLEKKDNFTLETFQQIMIKLLILHRKCQSFNGKFYCNHIKSFFDKIGYSMDEQRGVSAKALFPTLTQKENRLE